jgi:hypothetical protein
VLQLWLYELTPMLGVFVSTQGTRLELPPVPATKDFKHLANFVLDKLAYAAACGAFPGGEAVTSGYAMRAAIADAYTQLNCAGPPGFHDQCLMLFTDSTEETAKWVPVPGFTLGCVAHATCPLLAMPHSLCTCAPAAAPGCCMHNWLITACALPMPLNTPPPPLIPCLPPANPVLAIRLSQWEIYKPKT